VREFGVLRPWASAEALMVLLQWKAPSSGFWRPSFDRELLLRAD